jgi:hypothetical protein
MLNRMDTAPILKKDRRPFFDWKAWLGILICGVLCLRIAEPSFERFAALLHILFFHFRDLAESFASFISRLEGF